jgi:hypothetical protein
MLAERELPLAQKEKGDYARSRELEVTLTKER